MKSSLRITSILLVLIMSLSVIFTSCDNGKPHYSSDTSDIDVTTDAPEYQIPEDEYREPLREGYNQITFYWTYSGTYENCDVWVWWDGKDGSGYIFHECDYGAKAVINVPEEIDQVGFIVRKNCSDPGGSSWGNATKDFEQDRFATIDGKETIIYLKSGVQDQFISNDGGKTLEMMKKFTIAGMADEHKIQYRITPKTVISELDQVKVYEGDRELTVKNISTVGKRSNGG